MNIYQISICVAVDSSVAIPRRTFLIIIRLCRRLVGTGKPHTRPGSNDANSLCQAIALPLGSNACLADSLLQRLATKDSLNTALLDDNNARSKACRAARQHLICHEDGRLRPLVRDHFAVTCAEHESW